MKTAIMALALLVTGSIFGQEVKKERPSADERATKLTDRMTKKLELNAAQSAQILEINKGIALKNDAIRADQNSTKEAKKALVKSNHEARVAMYKGVLTPEQFAKYEAWEKEKIAKREARKAEGAKKGAKAKKGKKVTPAVETEEETEEDEL